MCFPNEIYLMIFKIIIEEQNNGLTLRNLRRSSKKFNEIITIVINDYYGYFFKIYLVNENNFWKNLITRCLIHSFIIDSECEINKIIWNSNYLNLYSGLQHVGLEKKFDRRYQSLKYGMKVYRKSKMINYLISERDKCHGGEDQSIRFKKFYKKYLSRYYIYRCYSIKRTRLINNIPVYDKDGNMVGWSFGL
jgi:hypothetical protein